MCDKYNIYLNIDKDKCTADQVIFCLAKFMLEYNVEVITLTELGCEEFRYNCTRNEDLNKADKFNLYILIY